MASILTTHVGSLPRSQDVVDHIFARENGEEIDVPAFDQCMEAACSETVRRQVEAGIDIVSDGETSKISYSTYVKDRYSGFSGDSPRQPPEDLKRFPQYLKRLADSGGTAKYSRPRCTGPVVAGGSAGSPQGYRQPEGRDVRSPCPRRLHECRLARSRVAVPAE